MWHLFPSPGPRASLYLGWPLWYFFPSPLLTFNTMELTPSQSSPFMDWCFEQRFSSPHHNYAAASLLALQSYPPEDHCHIFCGDLHLYSGAATVVFRFVPSPVQARFVLELRLWPSSEGKKSNAESEAAFEEEGMWAIFSVHDAADQTNIGHDVSLILLPHGQS